MNIKKLKESIEHFKKLNEMPQVIDKKLEFNKEYIDYMLVGPIQKALKENSVYVTEDKNIFKIPISLTDSIYLIVENDVIIGAGRFEYSNRKSLIPRLVKKFEEKSSKVALRLYSFLSKDKNVYIESDNIQTEHSYEMWKKWITNPRKYKIKKVKMIDTNGKLIPKDLEPYIWGKDSFYKNITIQVKW